MKRAFASTAASLVLALLTLAPAAGAATEFGSNCGANGGVPNLTFIHLSGAGNPLPSTAPTGGVITSWKSNVALAIAPGAFTGALQVWRPAGPLRFSLIAESQRSGFLSGSNSFPTRLPVQVGDVLGLSGVLGESGTRGSLYCKTEDPGDAIGGTTEPTSVGSTNEFEAGPGYELPAAAIIEPDADNDGYGDETQDGCPQSAAVQAACPVIVLDASAKVGRKAVTVLVAASSEGSASVKGVVKLGKGKKATLKTKAKAVFPGKIASFRLKFKPKLVKRLKELEPSKSLTLKVTTSATNVAGQVSTDKLKVKLKGQG